MIGMKKVFILNGSGGVGKDTFVGMVGEIIAVKHISIVDKVKEAARLFGWDNDKTERGRRFLSDLKDLSDGYNAFNMRYVKQAIGDFLDDEDGAKLLFVDVREPAQIQQLINCFPDARTVLVTRKAVAPIITNHADAGVLGMRYDYTIRNDGTLDDLREEAKRFMFCVAYVAGKEVLK